jgi:catechol 2,3-dioxygenase-like lactoylglutathione lyase family enzyme
MIVLCTDTGRVSASLRVLASLVILSMVPCQAAPASPAGPLQPRLVAISVADLAESVSWYRDILGFEILQQSSFPANKLSLAILQRDGFRIELVDHQDSVPPHKVVPALDNPALIQGFGKLAFQVEDLDAWSAELKAKGVRFQLEPRENPETGTKSFIVLDNSGNWLQFTTEPPGRGPEEQEKALIKLESRRSEAILAKDLQALDAIYAADFRGLMANGRFVNKAGLFEIFKTADPALRFIVDEVEARVLGNTAVTHGRITGRNPQGEIVILSKFTHVYVRRRGTWQLVEGANTPLPQTS